MRVLNEMRRRQDHGGRGVHAARAVFIFDDACRRVNSAAGSKRLRPIKAAAEATTRRQAHPHRPVPVGPLPYLRFNYSTGDAAGQNMVGKATLAACEWIKANIRAAASTPDREN